MPNFSFGGVPGTIEVPSYVAFGDTPSVDSFGRVRTGEPANRFDVEFIYNKQPDIIDEVVSGAGTATHNANTRDVTLAVVAATASDAAGLYSYDVPYTPGNSQLPEGTSVLNLANIANGECFVFLRFTISGTTVDLNAVTQTSWDNPVADVDWSKSQIFAMDFQSLKVGRIRFYLIRNGTTVKVHEIVNDNIRNSGFWQLPSLPLYWRIYNDATYTYMEFGYGDTLNAIGFRYRVPVNASATMKAICGTVKSEGGFPLFDIPGYQRSVDSNTSAITVSTTLIPIISIRPTVNFPTAGSIPNRGLYIPTGYSIQGDNPIRFAILYRPTLTNPNWTVVNATNSGIEYDVSASAVTGGIRIDSDYLAAGINARQKDENLLGRTLLKLGRTGTSDILTLAAIRTSTTNSATYGKFNWKEIR